MKICGEIKLIIVYCNFIKQDSEVMRLSKKELNIIQSECSHYENSRSAVIESLKIVQKNRGWISDNSIKLISKELNISESDIEGVATFYNQIFRQPVGQHIIRYCDSVVCYIAGCEKIKETLEYILNITVGNTTLDNKFTLLPTCCLGMCDKAPVIMINEDIYSHVIQEKLVQLLGLSDDIR